MNSMTGFGAASCPFNNTTIRVEISGVNRKQTEIAISLPRAWGELESPIREMVSQRISRGRINITISLQSISNASGLWILHQDKLEALKRQLSTITTVLEQPVETSLDSLLRMGIFTEETEADIPLEQVWNALRPAIQEALESFLRLRAQEGENMKQDLLSRILTMKQFRKDIMTRAQGVALRHRDTLMKRLEESGLPLPLDDERLIKEIALFADRCDVTEETTRLGSHLEQFVNICNQEEAVGRTLDFLCQEIFRELNTTGSKANDAELAQIVVSAKTELEKIREQVQNIE